MKHYKISRVGVEWRKSERATWKFAKVLVKGTQHTYCVVDGNLTSKNRWEVIVRVPQKAKGRVEVRVHEAPKRPAWAGVERLALMFMRGTLPGYRAKRFCLVALGQEEGRRIADWTEKANLPGWFRPLQWRMRIRKTVRAGGGPYVNKLVMLVNRADYEAMIRLFFATKVWTLLEAKGLP
jgi:hypothetical protein